MNGATRRRPRWLFWAALLLPWAVLACEKTSTAAADAGRDATRADVGADGASPDGRAGLPTLEGGVDQRATDTAAADLPAPSDGGGQVQAVALSSCDGRGPGTEDCHYANCPHTLCGAKACGGDDSLAWLAQQGF